MKNLYFLILLLTAGSTGELYAQLLMRSRPTWIGALPMQFNPSFAGAAGKKRISGVISYERIKYNDIHHNNYPSIQLSYDDFNKRLSSGIGVSLYYSGIIYNLTDNGTTSTAKTEDYGGNISVSPKISIKGNYSLAPSVSLNYNRTVLSDKVLISPYIINNISLTGGLLLNTPRFYIGYSVSYILNETSPFRSQSSKIYRWGASIITAGYTFQKSSGSDFSFTPQVAIYSLTPSTLYFQDKYFTYHNIGLNFRYKKLLAGIGHSGSGTELWNFSRSGSGMPMVMAGYQNEKIRIMYVQNINFKTSSPPFSDIALFRGELSARWLF